MSELKTYYKAYHRKCWAYKNAVGKFKKLRFAGHTASSVLALGSIGSTIGTGGIAVVAVGAVTVIIQGYMSYKKFDMKIRDCTYVYQSYQHILNDTKDMLRSGNFESDEILNKMKSVDKTTKSSRDCESSNIDYLLDNVTF